MKKFLKATACALALGMCCAAVACGDTGDGPGDGPGGVTKITLYAYQPEDWAVKYMNSVRDGFNEEYKDSVKLEIRYFYGTQFNSNLATAIENGNCPELFTISYSNLSAYVQNGYLEPLNSYFEKDHWDDIIPQTMDQIQYGENVIAYPWYIEPSSFLYYRKDIVEGKLGFTAEDLQTYDGIYEVCRAMVNKNLVPRGSFPIYIPVGIPRGWATVGMQYNCMNGKYIVSDDWLTSNLNDQGMKDLNKFYYTIGTNGWCPQQDMTERGYEDSVIGLGDEYWMMSFGGSWDIANIMRYYPEMKDQIGVVPIPTSTKERNGYEYATATNGGWNFCVSSSASKAKKEAAITFLNYMFNDTVERPAQFFVDSYQSRFSPSVKVQNYLNTLETETPSEWLSVVKTVTNLAISEPKYSWDIINLVNDMLASSMGAGSTAFETAYNSNLTSTTSKMNAILARGEKNPYYVD